MGYAAQQRVKSGFTWTDYGDKMVAGYERILGVGNADEHCQAAGTIEFRCLNFSDLDPDPVGFDVTFHFGVLEHYGLASVPWTVSD